MEREFKKELPVWPVAPRIAILMLTQGGLALKTGKLLGHFKEYLATLIALHFTPISRWVGQTAGRSFEQA